MAGRYFVDWSDSVFPQITPLERWEYDNVTPEGQTFTACKAEIREHFQGQIDFARRRLAELAALRAADVNNED
jgi:hypothetical protein